jgi:hypothetical protein
MGTLAGRHSHGSRTFEDIDERWRSAVVGSGIGAIEVIPMGEVVNREVG